ncbi:hypothetical protein J2Z19_001256 [Ensifer adhaerens]|uniref:Uncharacterized protein n=1 Tax=Ensifer adhaerens TaxID=106592 RepID=A0ACC5ST18_ENSAD|nr:hypothetical protein [Ensifer adhaerens]
MMSMENEAAAQALALDRSVSDAEINIAISHAQNAIEAAGETQSPGLRRALQVKDALEGALRLRGRAIGL